MERVTMKPFQQATFRALAAAVSISILSGPAAAGAEPKYDATITFHGGQRIHVTDIRLVYSWRELPSDSVGLTFYETRTKVERAIWVPNPEADQPPFARIGFGELTSLEVDSSLEQLGESYLYELRVRRVSAQTKDGKRQEFTDGLLGEGRPVLWPRRSGHEFPSENRAKQIENPSVSMEGVIWSNSKDTSFVFVFSPPVEAAIQSVLEKKRNNSPRLIEIRSAPSRR